MKRLLAMLLVLSQAWWAHADDIPLQSAAATHNQDGRLEVFGTGADGILYHRWQYQNRTGALTWGEWEVNHIGKARSARAARASSGELVVVFLDDGRVSVRHQKVKNGAWDVPTRQLGFPKLELQLGRNADGRLEIVTLEANRTVTTFPQVEGGAIDWQDPRVLGGPSLHSIEVALDGAGRLTIAGLTSSGGVQVIQQTVPNGAWGPWNSLEGHDLWQIAMAPDALGSLHLFARGEDGRIYRRSQSGNAWTPWTGTGDQIVMSMRAVAKPNGLVSVLGADGGGRLMSISQTRNPITGSTSWQREWAVVDETTRHWQLWDAAWDEFGGMVLGGYGSQAGAVRLLTTKDSKWDAPNWKDLKQPPANTPPDLRLQLTCCLDACPPLGGFDWTTLPALLAESMAEGAEGTDLASLVKNPGSVALCSGSPAVSTVGIWLNRSPSIQALRGMPPVDTDTAQIALAIPKQTLAALIDTRLGHLPNRFDRELKPRRDGELRIDGYRMELSNETDLSCGGGRAARMNLFVDGAVTLDPWGLGILNASFQAQPHLDLCADVRAATMRCSAGTRIDSSTGTAVSVLAALFAPWIANVAVPGAISVLVSGQEDDASRALGQCSIGIVLPSRIPIPAKPGAKPQSLVIPYSSAIGQPSQGQPIQDIIIHTGLPMPSDRSPSVTWTSVGKPIEAGAAKDLRKIAVRFKFNDMRGLKDADIRLSSTAPANFENITVSGATISYFAPPDDDPRNAYLSRIAIYAKDQDGLEVRSDVLVKLAR